MRTISLFLQLIGILVIATAGYWVWFVNWGPNPNDRIGTTVATFLPQPLKDWGCGKLNQRFAAESPTVCSGAATPPTTTPSDPSSSGGGRL